MNASFALPPPGHLARVLPIALGGLAPLAILGMITWAAPPGEVPWRELLVALLVLPAAGALMALTVHGRRVDLVDARLRVRRWPVPRWFDLSAMDLTQARVTDFEREPALRPLLNLAGSRMPGLRSGWFVLRDRRRGYVLTTSGSRVVVLPLRDGRVLLLGVERPDALLQALRDGAARRR